MMTNHTTNLKTYSELASLDTFEDRFAYLKLDGGVGRATFGFDRHINQQFYTSREWYEIRDYILIRDHGCDLGILGFEIYVGPLIHHMNPMGIADILNREDWILDPEYLITTTHDTHNAIHYGKEKPYPKVVTQRRPSDTRLW